MHVLFTAPLFRQRSFIAPNKQDCNCNLAPQQHYPFRTAHNFHQHLNINSYNEIRVELINLYS
jgi:hypothetical protein